MLENPKSSDPFQPILNPLYKRITCYSSLGSGWGFEEVLQFCHSNGFKYVTFADLNGYDINHGRLIKMGSSLGLRIRFLELYDDFDHVTDMDMLVRFSYLKYRVIRYFPVLNKRADSN